jgi:hypothetical protein
VPARYCLASLLVLCPVLAQAADTLQISGARSERDIACEDGQDVSISGMQHKIALTGSCGQVEIHGSGHDVTFETAQALYVTGIGNAATGRSVGKLTVDATRHRVSTAVLAVDAVAEVEVSGADQALELALAGPAKITVHGARNKVRWQAGAGVKAPAVEIAGIENSVARR